jgi:hypothetical protein
MRTIAKTPNLLDEVGEFLASGPSKRELLAFRPSPHAVERYRELLHRSSEGSLTREEQHEFNQFELIEMLMQNVKARIRAAKKTRS